MDYHLALAGDPVEHSLSPAMHSAALEATGLAGTYRLERCSASGLRRLVAMLRSGQLHGLNITMPHKQLASRLADELTPVAKRAGSVNSMKMENGRLWGHSTDAVAVQAALASARLSPRSPLLVLGAGGLAAAVLAATKRPTYLSARHPDSAEKLASRFPDLDVGLLKFGVAVAGAIVVNATPLGMSGESLPRGVIESATGLIDMPYGRNDTPAIRLARVRNIPSFDGYEFLAMQAAESFCWWTGRKIGVNVLLSAARNG